MSRQIRLIHAVSGILKRDDKVLVAERPEGKPYSGYWEFPGGKIESNESGEEALKRELLEELGISVLAASNVVTHEHVYPDKKVILQVWLVQAFEGEPVGLEAQKLQWVTWEEMNSLRLLEGNWAILEKLKDIL